jgi:hypothetical protein
MVSAQIYARGRGVMARTALQFVVMHLLPQMIAWLTRREKVSSFQSYLKMSMEDEKEELAHSRFTLTSSSTQEGSSAWTSHHGYHAESSLSKFQERPCVLSQLSAS